MLTLTGNSRLGRMSPASSAAGCWPADPFARFDALGNVHHYDDNQVILQGRRLVRSLNTKDTNIWQGDCQMVGRQGRSTADLMKQRGENRYTILENSGFTSVCRVLTPGASSVAK